MQPVKAKCKLLDVESLEQILPYSPYFPLLPQRPLLQINEMPTYKHR